MAPPIIDDKDSAKKVVGRPKKQVDENVPEAKEKLEKKAAKAEKDKKEAEVRILR